MDKEAVKDKYKIEAVAYRGETWYKVYSRENIILWGITTPFTKWSQIRNGEGGYDSGVLTKTREEALDEARAHLKRKFESGIEEIEISVSKLMS